MHKLNYNFRDISETILLVFYIVFVISIVAHASLVIYLKARIMATTTGNRQAIAGQS